MKTTKLLLIAFVLSAMTASSTFAQRITRTTARTSIGTSRIAASNWNHHRHYRSRSNVYFNFGFGYPYGYGYGYGYPYYGAYPYGYGYYTPRSTEYPGNGITDDATVAAVQRRLARGGYYHGPLQCAVGARTPAASSPFA